jgi:hypothetical protein
MLLWDAQAFRDFLYRLQLRSPCDFDVAANRFDHLSFHPLDVTYLAFKPLSSAAHHAQAIAIVLSVEVARPRSGKGWERMPSSSEAAPALAQYITQNMM